MAQKIYTAFAKLFIKKSTYSQVGKEKIKLKQVSTHRSKLMKAIMVDDVATDDSMKDVKYGDIKSNYSDNDESNEIDAPSDLNQSIQETEKKELK